MAKMFYTLDETKAALGRSEDDIKELAREGKLREFRDGTKLMYKTDQVEHLKAELAASGGGGGESLELAPDEDISLAHPSGSASGISLADSATGTRTGTRAGSSKGGSTAAGAAASADDTALAADLGLSGSVSGMPSSGKVAGSAAGLSGSHGTRAGLDLGGDEPAEKVDPSSQTSIAPGLNADQINIESVGSGSGLLDLTRESDDTSLGAELLDEIAPGASGVRRPPTESALSASALAGSSLGGSASGTGTGIGIGAVGAGLPATRGGGGSAATVVEAPDPLAPAFGLAAVGAACVLLFAVYAIVCGLSGDHPALLQKMGSSAQGGFSFLIVVAIVFALPVLLFVGGLVAGRTSKK